VSSPRKPCIDADSGPCERYADDKTGEGTSVCGKSGNDECGLGSRETEGYMEGCWFGIGNRVTVGCTDEVLEWIFDEDDVLGNSVLGNSVFGNSVIIMVVSE
jgi:hypothetical protein